jgi:hypothetical protein
MAVVIAALSIVVVNTSRRVDEAVSATPLAAE